MLDFGQYMERQNMMKPTADTGLSVFPEADGTMRLSALLMPKMLL